MSLEAAGCKYTNKDAFCEFCIMNENGTFCCKKYGELQKHPKRNEPWRAKKCGDDAADEHWVAMLKERQRIKRETQL